MTSKKGMSKPAILALGIFVLLMLILVIVIAVCACNNNDGFANTKRIKVTKETNFKSLSGHPIKRPYHPTWYDDIPEDHPEVKSLVERTKKQIGRVPKYTPTGFKKMKIPQDLFNKLQTHVRTNDRIKEDAKNIYRQTSSGPPPYLIPYPQSLKDEVFKVMQPILEEWTRMKGLIPTSAYGPREYVRGCSLRNHVDTEDTHVISVILQIDQEGIDKDWPLYIRSHDGKMHKINLVPGDMVLYESASCEHGRPETLNGDYYVNSFIHYAEPEKYDYLKKKGKLLY